MGMMGNGPDDRGTKGLDGNQGLLIQELPKKESNMEKNIAALLRTDLVTIHVSFLDGTGKLYTYVSRFSVEPSDYVIVYAVNTLKVVKVEVVDSCVKLQPGDAIKYKFVVDVINMANYTADMERNKQIEETVAVAYKK
jgi:hypothetical protein